MMMTMLEPFRAEPLLATTSLVTSVAAGMILWRLVGRWPVTYPLARMVVALWLLVELIVAVALALRVDLGGPPNPAVWGFLAHSVITIVLCAFWPRLIELEGPGLWGRRRVQSDVSTPNP
jgi:hypothetical protein